MTIPAIALLTLAGCDDLGGVRDQVRAVGSSTVYPFATAVAEQFVNKNPKFKSPIVEATGTGAGIKLFCAGLGENQPDIVNASRRMKRSEFDGCAANGVDKIVEIEVGLDGVAFAESIGGRRIPLTTLALYKALAATPFGQPQTAKTWHDVDPVLPADPIKVYGPPSTSGTRDALAELVLSKGCDSNPAMKALGAGDPDRHKKLCTTVREDGIYVDAGENDNLIVQKIQADPKAIGIFGFSFLEENNERLAGNTVNGVAPSYDSISTFAYPGARPLFIYVKAAHLRAVPGLREYVAEFAKAWGPDNYLKRRGMVVAPEAVRARSAKIATDMTPLDPAELR